MINHHNLYAIFKYILKSYIIPPGLWSKLSLVFNVSISKKSKNNKVKTQYPYSWNGQEFSPIEGSLYFKKCLQDSKTCVTRDFETKFCIQIKKKQEIKFSNIKNFEELVFSITPKNTYSDIRDINIKFNGEQTHFIKGKISNNSWCHIKLSNVNLILDNFIEIDWLGGDLYISELSFSDVKKSNSSTKKQKKIIVLVIDSMLAENINLISPNDTEISMTPYIDQYFKNGIYFKNSYSVSEYTMPSLATMMTGLFPIEHGVFTHDRLQRAMPVNIPTLSEILKLNGFKTFGYSTGLRYSPIYGHYRGFDRFFLHFPFTTNKTADDQVDKLIEFLEVNQSSNCFGLLHILDAHPPFSLNTYFSDLKSKDFRWGDTRELYDNFKLHRDSNYLIDELKKIEKTRILNLDFILSKLFAYINFKKIKDETTIILMSDHGREYKKKKPLLQNNLTHIPFMMSGQNLKLEYRNDFVEAPLDLYPTIMDICEIDLPQHLSGKNLFKDKSSRKFAISESLFKSDGEFAVRSKDWFYSINCHFNYVDGIFDFNKIKGEWLFKRNKYGMEYDEKNFCKINPSLQKKFYNIARDHYKKRKRYFSNKNIIKETINYPE